MTKHEAILQTASKSFEAEQKRAENLTVKAEKFIAATAVIAGFQVIDFKDLAIGAAVLGNISGWLAAFSLILLAISLIFALLSMQIRNYVSYPKEEELIKIFEAEEVTDYTVSLLLLKMYSEARASNAKINDNRARFLSFCGITLLFGFVITILSRLF